MTYKRNATYSGCTQDASWLIDRIVEAWLHGKIGPGRVTCRTSNVQVTVEFGHGSETGDDGERDGP